MLNDAYYYGLSPEEAKRLTVAELASFIKARRKKELYDTKVLASVGYTTGILASMALSKGRPKFTDCFSFPPEDKKTEQENSVKKSQADMLAWALELNKQHKSRKD